MLVPLRGPVLGAGHEAAATPLSQQLTSVSMTSVMERGVSRGIRTYCSRSGRDPSRSFLACFTQLITASKTGSSESTCRRGTRHGGALEPPSVPLPPHPLSNSHLPEIARLLGRQPFQTQLAKIMRRVIVRMGEKHLRERVPNRPSVTNQFLIQNFLHS